MPPSPYKDRIIAMREQEGLTFTEIASILPVTRNVVAGVCHRARIERAPPEARTPRTRDRLHTKAQALNAEILEDLSQWPEGASVHDLEEWLGEGRNAILHALLDLIDAGQVVVRRKAA